MATYTPQLGDTVEDTRRKRVGKVMGFEGPYVQLRPIGGGIEWDAGSDELRPLTLTEALSATMHATTALVLDENAELPSADELNNLTLLYRGHLLLIPEVEEAGLGLPADDTVRHRVHAGVAEARSSASSAIWRIRDGRPTGPTTHPIRRSCAEPDRRQRGGPGERTDRRAFRPDPVAAIPRRRGPGCGRGSRTSFGMTITDLNQIVWLEHPEGRCGEQTDTAVLPTPLVAGQEHVPPYRAVTPGPSPRTGPSRPGRSPVPGRPPVVRVTASRTPPSHCRSPR